MLRLCTFRHYAIFISNDFHDIVIEPCKIFKEKLEHCYGVKPRIDKDGSFNCQVGDYDELRNQIQIFSTKKWNTISNIFNCHLVDLNLYSKFIDHSNLNKLIETTNGSYVGYFTTKLRAYRSIIKMRKLYVSNLKLKLQAVANVTEIQKEFEEVYAENKRNTKNI